MCRDDGEPEEGCDCDFCVGWATGYKEGVADGSRKGAFHDIKSTPTPERFTKGRGLRPSPRWPREGRK
jgi:hypothetical protein